MRKALIKIDPFETGKQQVLACGGLNYQTNTETMMVDLTDWPTIDGEKALKGDVYYSPVSVLGNYFIALTELERKQKKFEYCKMYLLGRYQAVTNIANTEDNGISVHNISSTKAIMTAAERKAWIEWYQSTTKRDDAIDLNNFTLEQITPFNEAVFPVSPPVPNHYINIT
ncbi:MAG: hypothetical protein GY679_01280 [Mycoplasma sp.]|nr:hypothetical protein [Mycoplasma sp.]